MPGKNNTTPIGDGSVGLNNEVISVAGKMIDSVISENNLRAAISNNDPAYNGLFMAVTNMVSRWLPQDKARILQEYGNLQGLPKNASGNELDKYVAITLISRLPKNELAALVKKSSADSISLSGDMRKAEAKAAAYAKKQTNAITKNTIAELQSQAQDSNTTNDLLKSIDAKLGGIGNNKLENGAFYIDKYSQEAIAGLRKELDIILKNYTDGYLSKLLYLLNIKYDEGETSKSTLRKRINNVINCYVALIVGKTKGIHGNAFSPEAIVEIDKILSLTSFGYITGKVGLGDSAIIEKRKDAAKALKNQKAMLKNLKEKQKIKKDSKGNIKVKKTKTNTAYIDSSGKYNKKGYEFNPTREFKSGKYKSFYEESIKKLNDQYKLDNPDERDENGLRNLAVSFGIIDAASADIERIKVQVAQLLALEQYTLTKDMAAALKLKDPKKREEKAEAIKDRSKNSMTTALFKSTNASNIDQETSDAIPVISFNGNGKITSEGITKAVPVILMDSAVKLSQTDDGYEFSSSNKKLKLGTIQTTKDAQAAKGEDSESDKQIEKYVGDIFYKLFTNDKHNKESKFNKILQNKKTGSYEHAGIVSENTTMGLKDVLAKYGWGSSESNNANNNIQPTTSVIPTPTSTANTTQPLKPAKSKKAKKTINRSELKISNIYKLSNTARKHFKNDFIKEGVVPVLDLNRGNDFFKDIDSKTTNATNLLNSVNDISDKLGTINTNISSLLTAFPSLQEVGTTVNAAAGGGAAAKISSIANENAESVVNQFIKHATGGTAKRLNNSSSSIITGDARRGTNNKANPELVNIDWNKKQVNVQPIPMMATGGTVQKQESTSNLKTTSRLTSGERNKPLSIGISSGLVNYSKILQDVTDDGTNTAVKVYSINSGIHEKVRVGETEVSLFDSVYGIYSAMAVMSANSEVQKQLLSTIATAATAINTTTNKIANSSNSSSSFSFPDELNTILSGN